MIAVGLLAHNKPDCIADTVASLRHYIDDPRIVLFNGGSDQSLTAVAAKLGLDYCRYSKPLQHGKLIDFHVGLMKHLAEDNWPYEYMVTLDSDMLLVRDGFEAFLNGQMQASDYMATNFHYLGQLPDWEVGRYFLHYWRHWKPLFGDVRPAGCFNPGQIFRRSLVDRLLEFPSLPAVLQAARASRLPALEETIYSTLAVALRANPMTNPGTAAISLRMHNSRQLTAFLKDPFIFLVHKVQMEIDSPDRAFLRAVREGRSPQEFVIANGRRKGNVPAALARRICKDLYYKCLIRA